jgi:hypothetical protein
MKPEVEAAINGNYTPGPWEVEYGQIHPASEKEAYTIRTDAFDVVSGHLLIRREADAALIAAAPDLADALRESQAREKRLRDQNADLLSQLDAMQFMHNVQVVRQKRLREALESLDATLASYLCVVTPGGQSIRASNPKDFEEIEPDVAVVWKAARAALAEAMEAERE